MFLFLALLGLVAAGETHMFQSSVFNLGGILEENSILVQITTAPAMSCQTRRESWSLKATTKFDETLHLVGRRTRMDFQISALPRTCMLL
ncbi:hypothetical protein Y032_0020g53 [Ancylostoma ceylanicum]|uniref:Uncharacterized protein n=1 Tax=Ancylostoma ceylanicum TaxID=53326 RepID=A0A016V180_9BILA|nr:hypothetical protein Y032_0020g53 [Ancylostoma ceylanicum]